MNPDDFGLLVEALRRRGVYDQAVSSVEVIETHISVVLLAGDYAYKVKKPVDFGFVDFSTLEKRRHYCEEELRLNRCFTPTLYLEVVPIHGSADVPRVGGDGRPVSVSPPLVSCAPCCALPTSLRVRRRFPG